MMRNSPSRFGWVAIALHWLIAALIGVMIVLGLVMTGGFDDDIMTKIALFQWHKSTGIAVLALVVVRLAWRLANPVPALPGTLKAYERGLAHATHLALYLLMLAIPVSGWLIASASTLPTEVFGLFALPRLITPDRGVEELVGEVHETLAWVMLGVLALHVAAALKHHFILKDDVLVRMLPGGRTAARGGR